MRVIRSSGQNVSPSDDGKLYQQAFEDGLFEPTTINSLGGNLVSLGAMYGIMQGRDFTVESQSINVELPSSGNSTGYIYVQFDTTTSDVITIESALTPFTPTYDDINESGTICQMIIAEYTASAVAVTSIESKYPTASTKANPTLVGSVAQIETSPATASHSVGQYFVYNDQLYEVIAAISVGETLVVGTNIVATTVGNEIYDLKTSTWTPVSTPFTPPSDGIILIFYESASAGDTSLRFSDGTYTATFTSGGARMTGEFPCFKNRTITKTITQGTEFNTQILFKAWQ